MTLKQKIRAFLGLDSVPSVEMFLAHESTMKRRNKEVIEALENIKTQQGEIFNALGVIRGDLIAARAFEKPSPMPAPSDWEQVSVQELMKMINEPSRDEN